MTDREIVLIVDGNAGMRQQSVSRVLGCRKTLAYKSSNARARNTAICARVTAADGQ